jgi:CBS domain-containing protein
MNSPASEDAMTYREIGAIVRNQRPLTLPEDVTVMEACSAMCERHVGAVLVTDPKGGLAGIFTARDAVYRVLSEGKNARTTKLGSVMTRNPATMGPAQTAVDALRLMNDGGFRHVPVLDGSRIVGVVSAGDMRGLEKARLDEETGLWERI